MVRSVFGKFQDVDLDIGWDIEFFRKKKSLVLSFQGFPQGHQSLGAGPLRWEGNALRGEGGQFFVVVVVVMRV